MSDRDPMLACAAKDGYCYYCTEPKGHAGEHVYRVMPNGPILRRWPAASAVVETPAEAPTPYTVPDAEPGWNGPRVPEGGGTDADLRMLSDTVYTYLGLRDATLVGEWICAARAEVARLTAELSRLRAEIAESEQACLEEIENRDRFEDQVTAIYHALGGTNEWSNLHDLGDEAVELASRLRAEIDAPSEPKTWPELWCETCRAYVVTTDADMPTDDARDLCCENCGLVLATYLNPNPAPIREAGDTTETTA